MDSKYKKLEKLNYKKETDYLDSVFVDNLPEVVSENNFTHNFFKSVQRILSLGFLTSESVSKYFKF